ncbi:hypothetical protein AcV5_001792 [Taiwanofungus camphoratus]|nr:hypothetical protein AcV5_001792 [Antrodia cinnamomea]
MTSTTSRTPYIAGTPDRTHFGPDIPLSILDHASFSASPASSPSDAHVDRGAIGLKSAAHAGLKSFSSRCVLIVQNNAGLLMIASSQAFGSMMNVLVKKLNSLDPPVPTSELIFVRMTITWLCSIIYMSIMKVPDPILGPKGVRLLLVFRGFCGFFGLFGTYYSLRYLSLSDATVLQFLAPMCTAIVGALVLKEDFKRSQAVASVCSLIGVVLIARPTFLFGSASRDLVPELDLAHDSTSGNMGTVVTVTPAQRLGAVGTAMLGVLGATGAYTSIRAIGKRAHPLHNLVAFSSQCMIASSIAMIFIVRSELVFPTRIVFLFMLLAIGFCGFGGQMLMTMGLQRETAGRGTMAIYVQIIFATVYDRIFFHSTPPPLSVVGTVIIMSSAIYVALTKQNSTAGIRETTGVVDSEDPALEEGLLANQEPDAETLKDYDSRTDPKVLE